MSGYSEGAVVRAEDFGPIERAYAEAMHEDCPDPPAGHPLADHSPWSGGDLDGTETWPSFVARLARHGLALADTAPGGGLRMALAEGIHKAMCFSPAALPEGWWFEVYRSGVIAGDVNPHTGWRVTSPEHRFVAVAQPTWYPLGPDNDGPSEEVRAEADSHVAVLLALAARLTADGAPFPAGVNRADSEGER